MRKGFIAILILLCLGLGAAVVGIYVISDREGPEISFGSGEFVYEDAYYLIVSSSYDALTTILESLEKRS